jgi:hypothetical protein
MKSSKIIEHLEQYGISLTRHAEDKLFKENLFRRDIFEVLRCGKDSIPDSSVRNDKSFAWNNAQHETITFNNLTVVFCIGSDLKVVVNSVYHGNPHDILSNQYNRTTTHSYSFGNRKVFR